MSFTGLVGYGWAGAPPHSTMETSPSATANSLCMSSSSNDVAGKVYPNCPGKLVLACPASSGGCGDAEIGLERRAVIAQRGAAPVPHDAAALQDRCSVGHGEHLARVLLDDDGGETF